MTVCILGFPDACYDFLWECVESCCGFCDNVIFCDLDAPIEAIVEMCDYRRLKRTVPTVYYGKLKCMLEDVENMSNWFFLIFPDEVVHHSSWHYIWDFGVRHSESGYDGGFAPIMSGDGSTIHESPRMISSRLLRRFCRDGVKFIIDGDSNMLPSGLFPRPIWKLPVSIAGIEGVDVPVSISTSPSVWNEPARENRR